MSQTLHIFALNGPNEVIHTNYTRQKGQAPALPPLADWLGVDTLDTDKIELFKVKDLSDVPLSDYIDMAFATAEDMSGDIKTRLNALEGSVLLVPDDAITQAVSTGADLTQIAQVPLAQADHGARLPKAAPTPAPAASPAPAPREHEAAPPVALYMMIGMAVFAALVIFVGWS